MAVDEVGSHVALMGDAKTQYLFLSPWGTQARFLADLVKRGVGSKVRVTAGLSDGESRPRRRLSPYDAVVRYAGGQSVAPSTVVVPTGARSTRARLEEGSVVLGKVSLSPTALVFYDKRRSLELAGTAGLLVPKTAYGWSDVDFEPVFYKSAWEVGGGRRGFAASPEDVPDSTREGSLFQEHIQGDGVIGVAFLARDGQMLTHHIHHEVWSLPRWGGSAVVARSIQHPTALTATRSLVNAVRYSGWGLAEFIESTSDGRLYFMELNAKFWASCELAFTNEPQFARLLFGIDVRAHRPATQITFWRRAARRGPVFVARRSPVLIRGRVGKYG